MELDDLYQEVLLDHYRSPRRAGAVNDEELAAEEVNPSCGDHIRLAVRIEDGRIADVRHQSRGCAISMASASIMADFAAGRTPAEFRRAADTVIAMLRGERPWDPSAVPDLEALGGVHRFPMRVKCATMCWHAMKKALDARGV
ncbi:MAG: SUF system NifU family Fe-S cluster assembly protein [Kiritimatiellae bacterium]|nr:SUF system NifU family Fe-S cluster assembly protein [Kiritimatiellia bacterium]